MAEYGEYENFLSRLELETRTVQPVDSRYNEHAMPPLDFLVYFMLTSVSQNI